VSEGNRYAVLGLAARLVRALVDSWRDPYTLAADLGVTRQTVLRLIRALRQTGLVVDRRMAAGRASYRVTRTHARAWLEAA
jgi:predicted transcriptional regulator